MCSGMSVTFANVTVYGAHSRIRRIGRGVFFFSSRRRHTRFDCDWSSDVCSSDLEPSARCWDAALSADPWTWLGDQITSLGAAAGPGGDGAPWPLDPADAAELPGLAGTVVATARQFGPDRCRSAGQCHQLTRDVQEAVQIMM